MPRVGRLCRLFPPYLNTLKPSHHLSLKLAVIVGAGLNCGQPFYGTWLSATGSGSQSRLPLPPTVHKSICGGLGGGTLGGPDVPTFHCTNPRVDGTCVYGPSLAPVDRPGEKATGVAAGSTTSLYELKSFALALPPMGKHCTSLGGIQARNHCWGSCATQAREPTLPAIDEELRLSSRHMICVRNHMQPRRPSHGWANGKGIFFCIFPSTCVGLEV